MVTAKSAVLRSAAALLLYSSFALVSSAQAQNLPTIAVYKSLPTDSAKVALEKNNIDLELLRINLETGLRASRQFSVFERETKVLQQAIYAEQNFALDARAIGDAANFGKMNNVSFIVQPIIANFSVSSRSEP